MNPHVRLLLVIVPLWSGLALQNCPGASARVEVRFNEGMGPLRIDQMALGQGGLSAEPMWSNRIPEIRALRPKVIRLFIQEYFDLLPANQQFRFEKLDRSVDTILATGAKPLMCICFKPHLLFPKVDQDAVEPVDYRAWDELVFNLAKHYLDRGAGIRYWEVANEPDIGEDGGCPYRFTPETYVRYYQHTASAILRADPDARVGGPALAGSGSALLPALLSFCETNRVPLHFVSWHSYSSNPKSIRETIEHVHRLLKEHPALKPETFLDEWNMDLMNPNSDRRFQPCFICETIWQMKEAQLDYSCYYHIRDWHVRIEEFQPFMSARGAAFMTRWWNRMPQFDGLFDYQDQVRPAYYAFKLLSRLAGEQLRIESDSPSVHGFASRDNELRCDNLLLWNFSGETTDVEVTLKGLVSRTRLRHIRLDALAPSMDENDRLRPEPFVALGQERQTLHVKLEPYAVHYWYFE
jgi:xylan 1,4-beta-xylosidase